MNPTLAIKKAVIMLGEYYDRNLSENQVIMYAQDLSILTIDELERAIRVYRNDPTNTRFPLPSQLVAAVRAGTSPKMKAIDLARRLEAAVKKHDYVWELRGGFQPHSSFKAAVDAELGDLAFEVIRRRGGWLAFCNDYHDSGNPEAFSAQLRDHVEAVMSLSRAGLLSEKPALPPPPNGGAQLPPNGRQPVRIGENIHPLITQTKNISNLKPEISDKT